MSAPRNDEKKQKTYLGDGAYAELGRFGDIVLTTEDGIRVTNSIVLEPEVWAALVRFVTGVAR